jgi:hypothetical protein
MMMAQCLHGRKTGFAGAAASAKRHQVRLKALRKSKGEKFRWSSSLGTELKAASRLTSGQCRELM